MAIRRLTGMHLQQLLPGTERLTEAKHGKTP